MNKAFAWLDERLGLTTIYNVVLDRKVPKVNWWFTLGSASAILFALQGVTGMFLAIYYVPSPESAYDSVNFIMNGVSFGWLIRGIHHWGASLMVIVVFMHMLRTFYYGAYKYPREFTWITGVVLLLCTLGMGFTGYLLPWNQRAYWATTVGTEIPGTFPFIGPFITSVLRGGADLSGLTLTRFFAIHIWFLPALIAALIGVHIYMVIKLGISSIPSQED
ncbi:MAG: cytochrome b6 [Anaerolineae bacterium UTCFX2]|jgi:quinol-cytochrome oxidoreductase complex cytochrome b subunit|nr:cytochrome b N-terminal domain-containing protein [Anaerolineae bacterium]MCZ7552382.1 cytochrome b N-terminal domain-containing protein [Anaerolineales bacterium]OQY91823.1 MAG: cytochrome b6 [Anaerolineae bacterium UTCFX2]